ncbi:MAG TPA: hypothetical protein GXZ61_02215 [Clostridiales bacterium]|jgi:Na+-transporting methylmalonyl-CoA/oxaloacetate decarboxylase gamma subunit|nr:hypothetical protein [Clostridiales bacterium]
MINVKLFLETLNIMWKGMLGIFIVTGIIMLAVAIMNRLNSKSNDNA